jgi:glycosyltransferase involved in cell wall biosynthesis
MGPHVKYSIIVPAFNEEKELPEALACLNEIKRKLAPEWQGEIIVVDNNSSDHTAKIARSHHAIVVFEKENCIARARNAGARSARGKFLIFVDADTRVSARLVRKTLEVMRQSRVCGGGTLIHFDVEPLPLVLRTFYRLWYLYTKHFPLAAGAYLFCLKEGWQAVGGFDEKVYASEEVWFSMALKKWGKKRNLSFVVLDIPVVTSARKMDQYSTIHLFTAIIILMIFPWAVRSRRMCRIWYERNN